MMPKSVKFNRISFQRNVTYEDKLWRMSRAVMSRHCLYSRFFIWIAIQSVVDGDNETQVAASQQDVKESWGEQRLLRLMKCHKAPLSERRTRRRDPVARDQRIGDTSL